jgi:hypothetical protein
MGDGEHRAVGARQTQSSSNRGEAFLRKHGKRDEGFGQQSYIREIQQDRLPVLVDAEVAGVHVGLGEHESITAYLDWRHLPPSVREPRVRLVHMFSEHWMHEKINSRHTLYMYRCRAMTLEKRRGAS